MGEAKQTADEGGAGQVQNAGRGGLSTGENLGATKVNTKDTKVSGSFSACL